jgi:hypothetical protein
MSGPGQRPHDRVLAPTPANDQDLQVLVPA